LSAQFQQGIEFGGLQGRQSGPVPGQDRLHRRCIERGSIEWIGQHNRNLIDQSGEHADER
jgi:hypothetical protein